MTTAPLTISERIRRQDAPTVRAPKLRDALYRVPPISRELAKLAYDRLEDELVVRVYEGGLLVSDLYAVTAADALELYRAELGQDGKRIVGREIYIVTGGEAWRFDVDDNDVMPDGAKVPWCGKCCDEHAWCWGGAS